MDPWLLGWSLPGHRGFAARLSFLSDEYIHGLFFAPLRDMVINANGQVAMPVVVINRNDTNQAEFALYSGSSAASFMPVARWGADIPGLPGVSPLNFSPALAPDGRVAIGSDLRGATNSTNNLALMIGTTPTNLAGRPPSSSHAANHSTTSALTTSLYRSDAPPYNSGFPFDERANFPQQHHHLGRHAGCPGAQHGLVPL